MSAAYLAPTLSTMNIRAHHIVRTFGVTLAAGALALASSVSAHAATQWELIGGEHIFLVSPSVPDGTCLMQGGRFTDEPGSRVSTLLFDDAFCTQGAAHQCRTTVPVGPDVGHLRLNATTCSWTVQ